MVMDEKLERWQRAHGWFAYEIASGLLTGLVVSGALSKAAATKLISNTLNHLSKELPDLREELQEIAAKGTAQVEMVSIQADRMG